MTRISAITGCQPKAIAGTGISCNIIYFYWNWRGKPGDKEDGLAGQAESRGRGQGYSSPLMHDRRRRIMDAARVMLAEGGLERFSMRELGLRADVAQRTLYNAFQSRDHLLAEAVTEYYAEFNSHMVYRHEAGTLEGMMERLLLVHRRNIKIRNYTGAVMALYFAANINHELWTAIHVISADNHRLWLQRMAAKRQLHPWVDVNRAADRMANLEYATINEWCQHRIADEDFVVTLTAALLTFAAGLARGAAHRQIVTAIAGLAEPEAVANAKPA